MKIVGSYKKVKYPMIRIADNSEMHVNGVKLSADQVRQLKMAVADNLAMSDNYLAYLDIGTWEFLEGLVQGIWRNIYLGFIMSKVFGFFMNMLFKIPRVFNKVYNIFGDTSENIMDSLYSSWTRLSFSKKSSFSSIPDLSKVIIRIDSIPDKVFFSFSPFKSFVSELSNLLKKVSTLNLAEDEILLEKVNLYIKEHMKISPKETDLSFVSKDNINRIIRSLEKIIKRASVNRIKVG